MIKDNIINSYLYENLSDEIKQAFHWLKSNDLKDMADGKYEIFGDKVYANVQKYITKDDALYEVHKKYIDIQYIVSGREKIGLVSLEKCKTTVEYDTEKDIEFLTNDSDDEYQILSKNEFLIIYPPEAHKPSI